MIRALEVAFNDHAGQGRFTMAVEVLDQATGLALEIVAHLTRARALRAAGDEPAAVVAAHVAQSLAAAKQDIAAQRQIMAFLSVDG